MGGEREGNGKAKEERKREVKINDDSCARTLSYLYKFSKCLKFQKLNSFLNWNAPLFYCGYEANLWRGM